MRTPRDKKRLMIGGAIAAVVIAGGGLAVWSMTRAPEAAPEAEAEEAHGAGEALEMDAARIQTAGIILAPVGSGSLSAEIVAQGTVVGTPQGEAVLAARADGVISRVSLRLGDSVRAGQTVALIESREASTIAAERSAAQARLTAARQALAREQRLFDAQITARQDLEAAITARRTAEADLQRADAAVRAAGVTGGRYLAVRSPIGGRITEVDTQLGAYVSAGAELFNVSNPRSIQIEAAVPAGDAQKIRPGDAAIVELPNGGIVESLVRSVTPALDRESRAATVVLQMNGAPGGLAQGQAVRVRITPRGSKQGEIVLPEEAVQQVEGRDMVFVQTRGGFQAVPVSVGSRSGGRIEILDGLKAGQTAVTGGAFVLKSQLGASEAEH